LTRIYKATLLSTVNISCISIFLYTLYPLL